MPTLRDAVRLLTASKGSLPAGLVSVVEFIADRLETVWGQPGRRCSHCGEPVTDDYMLKREVWGQAWSLPTRGFLHLRCVEDRLGRALTAADFSDAPLNTALLHFARRVVNG